MEIRKDYLLNRWVIISKNRSKRPREFERKEEEKISVCYFCSGNENLTPPEIKRVEEDGQWIIRVFPNKFATTIKEGDSEIKTDNKYYTHSSAYGSHEVIVETPEHGKGLAQLSKERILKVLKIYADRINELSKDSKIKYVSIFKNHGKDAGASIVHSHSQVISLNLIPPSVYAKINAIKTYENCPHCEIIEKEKNSERRCFENDSFIAFTPYASRFHYEIWIYPKEHIRTFNEFDDKKYSDLSEIIKETVMRLDTINANYNLLVTYSPENKNLHFHIEIIPRLSTFAGFEYDTNITINSVSPEDAAKFYRDEE